MQRCPEIVALSIVDTYNRWLGDCYSGVAEPTLSIFGVVEKVGISRKQTALIVLEVCMKGKAVAVYITSQFSIIHLRCYLLTGESVHVLRMRDSFDALEIGLRGPLVLAS